MTIPKAMQADKAFCRLRNTWAIARWRGKHRAKYNAYQREYQKKYQRRLRRKREAGRS
jgi:hypothetical protein